MVYVSVELESNTRSFYHNSDTTVMSPSDNHERFALENWKLSA